MNEDVLRILFVDDEPNILAGMRRMLRPMHSAWKMAFVNNGYDALKRLGEEPFDVVVTDMRMPGMDGATLLQETALRHPNTIRFVLSGQSDHGTILRAISATHQFLAKPCNADVLKEKIQRAAALRSVVQDQSLRDYITQLKKLPSPSRVCHWVVQCLMQPEANMNIMGDVVAGDPSLTLKMLQLVNSGLFGHQHGVCTARRAVKLVGMEIIQALVESADLFDEFFETQPSADMLNEVISHAQTVGEYAYMVAGILNGEKDSAELGGCLHTMGRIIMMAEHAARMAADPDLEPVTFDAMQILEPEAAAGAYLLGLWGFPKTIVQTVLYCANPSDADDKTSKTLAAVHIADVLVAVEEGETSRLLDVDFLKALAVNSDVTYWQEMLAQKRTEREEDPNGSE